jgi:hypothetical protein
VLTASLVINRCKTIGNVCACIAIIIKEVLTQEDWAKYLKYEDIETLRNEIVTELINTSKSFLEVKKNHLG